MRMPENSPIKLSNRQHTEGLMFWPSPIIPKKISCKDGYPMQGTLGLYFRIYAVSDLHHRTFQCHQFPTVSLLSPIYSCLSSKSNSSNNVDLAIALRKGFPISG